MRPEKVASTWKIWVGDALKFAESLRAHADGRLVGCGLGSGGTSSAGGPVGKIKSFPEGGSGAWDDKVKVVIVQHFDTNGSGWVDTPGEVSAIPCDVWGAMDAGVKQSYSYGLRPIYGFEEGYNWIGYAVGFSESVRVQGDAALQRCGYPQ